MLSSQLKAVRPPAAGTSAYSAPMHARTVATTSLMPQGCCGVTKTFGVIAWVITSPGAADMRIIVGDHSSSSYRKDERERAAFAECALDHDAAAVRFDGELAERQAEACAHFARIELTEFFEDAAEGFRGNALAGVADRKPDRLRIVLTRADRHGAGPGEFDGVADEIHERADQLLAVAGEGWQIGGDVGNERCTALFAEKRHLIDRLLYERRRIDFVVLKLG